MKRSQLWIIAAVLGTTACASAPPKTPLRLASEATGDQRRLLFEALLKEEFRDADVRLTAVGELHRIGSLKSTGPLIDALRDPDAFVQTGARRALIQFGPPALEALLARVQDADEEHRAGLAVHLTAALTADGESSLPAALRERILERTRFVRCSGELCVERVGRPSYPAIAFSARIRGDVLVQFSLQDGQATDLIAYGAPLLASAAMETVRQFRFLPRNSQLRYQITVAFAIDGKLDGNASAEEYALPGFVRITVTPISVQTKTLIPSASPSRGYAIFQDPAGSSR